MELLLGDPTKAKTELGWEHTYSLQELVKDMMTADVALMQREEYLKEGGHETFNVD